MLPSEEALLVLPTVVAVDVVDDDDKNDNGSLVGEDPVASLLGMSNDADDLHDAVAVTAAAAASSSFANASSNYSHSSMPLGTISTTAVAPSDKIDDGNNDARGRSVAGNHQQQQGNNNNNNTHFQKSSSVTAPMPFKTTSTSTTTTAPQPPPLLQQLKLENSTLREKNDKLKSLLGRSAKAQRDAKHELERTKRLYESVKLENEALGKRVEALANRPTHMDLLADFEANFDRALLSIGNGGATNNKHYSGQSGGEDAAESSSSLPNDEDSIVMNEVASSSVKDGTMKTTATTTPAQDTTTTATTTAHLLLLAEIDEANSQIENLQSIHAALQQRYDSLEQSYLAMQKERKSLNDTCAILRLELRGTKSDAEKWERERRMALATVEEMRLEVDLATRAAAEANRRASYAELGMTTGGMMMMMTSAPSSGARGSSGGAGGDQPRDGEYVAGLEAKVAALQEWALASAESKTLTSERCMELEERVRELEEQVRSYRGDGKEGTGAPSTSSVSFENEGSSLSSVILGNAGLSAGNSSKGEGSSGRERKLWTKSSSLVVGAGMVGHVVLELGLGTVEPSETVILRWKFDITPSDLDIDFSVLKGMCEDARARRGADACLRVRRVMGGGGGDVGGVFARQNACTMVWSNEMSWVRPRTIKWTAEAVAIMWGD